MGGLAALVLAAGLALRLAALVPVALALLGAEYALFLTLEDVGLDERAPLFAAGLLVAGELSYWSLELRSAVTDEPGSFARRVAFLMLLALTGMLVGGALLAVVDALAREGLAVEIVGALATAAAIALLWLSSHRTER